MSHDIKIRRITVLELLLGDKTIYYPVEDSVQSQKHETEKPALTTRSNVVKRFKRRNGKIVIL